MTHEDFMEVLSKSESSRKLYADHTKMKIIVSTYDDYSKYPYQSTKNEGLVNPLDFGFTDRFYGGRCYVLAKVKDKPFYMIIDRGFNTIGLFYPHEMFKDCTITELKSLCTRFRKKFNTTSKKEELIFLLTGRELTEHKE